MYYFDHSATTPLIPEVSELINGINREIYGNPSSVYSSGRESRSIIENARNQVANSISANPEQIIFTSGGTESNNHVLWSLLNNNHRHAVSNKIEHPAILKVLHFLSQYGLKYDLVGVLSNGIVSVEEIEKAILPETSLISLMLANNEIGTIQPIKDVVEIARKYNVLVHTDAVQCLGKMEVNVLDLGVDFLSLSAHKFYGPKGVGILYAKDPKKLSSLIIGGGQERGLRAGTESISAIAGMGLAAEHCVRSLSGKRELLIKLEKRLKSGINKFYKRAIYNGNQFEKLPGLINISFPKNQSNIMMAKLDRDGIAISNGPACGSGDVKPSPVLSEIGLDKETNLSSLRFSFGSTNTDEEVDYLLNKLELNLIK